MRTHPPGRPRAHGAAGVGWLSDPKRHRGSGMSTIPDFLDTLASRHGTKTAIIADDETVSFAELARRSERVAAGLAALGVGRGDRVAIWLPNLPAWLELACACARLGAVVVSCNTRFRSTEMADILARSGAKVLVLSPDFKRIP